VEKNKSFTPLVIRFNNMVPGMRHLLGNLKMVGFLPPHVKNYNAHLRPFVEQVARHSPGRTPIKVFDAFSGTHIDVYLMIAWCQNDIRGIPSTTSGKSPPCLIGGCNACEVVGRTVKGHHGTIMPGACQFLGWSAEDQELRDEYAETFAENDEWAEMATEDRPAARTHDDAVAEGKLVASGRKTRKESAFVDLDVFSELLPGWNKVEQTKYDLAHELGNIVKHVFSFIRNRKGSKGAVLFTPKKLQVGHHCHAFAHT
jgi:hypothetical protein